MPIVDYKHNAKLAEKDFYDSNDDFPTIDFQKERKKDLDYFG